MAPKTMTTPNIVEPKICRHNGAPRETTHRTMTRIFDNIEKDLLTTLRGTMQVSKPRKAK